MKVSNVLVDIVQRSVKKSHSSAGSLARLVVSRLRRLVRNSLWIPNNRILAIDTWIVKLGQLSFAANANRYGCVVLCPPGGGNIGDSALIQATLENLGGEAVAVLVSSGERSNEALRSIETVTLRPLFYGNLATHWVALWRLSRRTAQGAKVYLIGADTLDGAYNAYASELRITVLSALAKTGMQCVVLGFSWNETPHPRCVTAMQELAPRAKLYARDPMSQRRLEHDGVSPCLPAADIVFASAKRESESSDGLPIPRQPFALVNVSALVGDEVVDHYRTIVQWLIDRDLAVVLLPHVSRSGSDDIRSLELVRLHFDADVPIYLIDRLLSPNEVRCYARHAQLAVTGRMHLGVICLSELTPAVVVSTQGKVEGLMELFSLPQLCLAADGDMAQSAIRTLQEILGDSAVRDRIRLRLPEVERLARGNFSDV